MPKPTLIEKQWEELMDLCRKESEFRRGSLAHPKVLKIVSQRIDELARQMGFGAEQIRTREFRAERDGSRILRISIRT